MSPDLMSLDIADLNLVRGGAPVLRDISARLPAGAMTAIVGPNGAGKSSLLGAIAGVLKASGRVTLAERPIDPRAIAYMPQAALCEADLSVFEVALLGRLEGLGWRVGEPDIAAAEAALDALGLGPLAERSVATLSGGQQQLALLAQQLARAPRLMLLDEPTSALDLGRQLSVLHHLAAYAQGSGAVVVVALHDLSLAARYASHLLLLKDGRLLREGLPARVIDTAAIREAWEVEAEIVTSAAGHIVVAPLCACGAGDYATVSPAPAPMSVSPPSGVSPPR